MADPYRFRDEMPPGALQLANTLDGGDRELPDHDWLPVAVDTPFEATMQTILDLETHQDIDVLDVLLAICSEGSLSTEDVVRAIHREAAITRSNATPNRRGGRPSKVESVANEILNACTVAEEGRYMGDPVETRNARIRKILRQADISRRTFYRIRDRVQEEAEIDLSNLVSPTEITP